MNYKFAAPCLFGLEALAAEEFREMGASEVSAENGRVIFKGSAEILARANICSRYAERILIIIGEFPARTFTELFDGVRALPLSGFIGKSEAFPVKGWSRDSALHSIPDCQAIIKKAAAENLKSVYKCEWMPETGAVLQLQFSIHKDNATIYLDTSGDGLHKRGYRSGSGVQAPLKETLAAGIAKLSRIYPDSRIYDPFCGSGTLLIESALIGLNIAPGLHRYFAAERYAATPESVFRTERGRAAENIKRNKDFIAFGFDIDPAAVELTLSNAKKAGVAGNIRASVRDISKFETDGGRGNIITNPPYGERLLDNAGAEKLYKIMGTVFPQKHSLKYNIICPHEDFEDIFGRKADKRRKLYNGMIKCQLFQYFK